jgi:hypothetical protein
MYIHTYLQSMGLKLIANINSFRKDVSTYSSSEPKKRKKNKNGYDSRYESEPRYGYICMMYIYIFTKHL